MSLDAFKTASKRAIHKTAKIANKIKKVLKNSQQNNSETVTNKNDQEIPKQIPKERYISPEERQKLIIGCLTLFKAFLPTTYFN